MNSSFSQRRPTLQLALDSTSLGEFKICPRRYQLGILLGYRSHFESVHLVWGLHIHDALEHYWHFKFGGMDHEAALQAVVQRALVRTWNKELNRPWTPDHPTKNRWTLIRTIVWYLDQFGETDPLQTLELSNGKPAVELSFRFESGYRSRDGEPFIICGHLDRLVTFQGEKWIVDFKSTQQTLSPSFFDKFTPDNQFTIYTLAGRIAFHTKVDGVIVDGCQTAVNFSRFDRQIVTRSDSQLQEWFDDLSFWLSQMEECSTLGRWPQNDKACQLYGGCPFLPVCRQHSPEAARTVLTTHYTPRVWDPLQVRGDI